MFLVGPEIISPSQSCDRDGWMFSLCGCSAVFHVWPPSCHCCLFCCSGPVSGCIAGLCLFDFLHCIVPMFGYQGCVLCCFLSGVLCLRFPCSPSTCHSVPPGWTVSWCMLGLNQLFNPCWDLINLIRFKTTDQQTNRHRICKLQEINILKALKIMATGKNSSDEGFICCLCSLPAPGNRERLSHIIRILQCSLILTLHMWWLNIIESEKKTKFS